VLLNRRRGNDVITMGDVQKSLGKDVFASLPSDDVSLTESLNTGRPEVLRNRSKYGKDLEAMSKLLMHSHSTNGKNHKKGGVLSVFRRSRS
jgi:septum formation inhibitor-activating ATPase MinD